MPQFRTVTERFSASPQLTAADFASAAALGVTLVINNRPEGEAPDQIPDAEARRLAEAAGLAYANIPVRMQTLGLAEVDAMRAALEAAPGPVLAYCASGTRSTALWALARAQAGDDVEGLIAAAGAAGYDLEGLRPALQNLAAAARE